MDPMTSRTVRFLVLASALPFSACSMPTHYGWTGGDGKHFRIVDSNCQGDSQPGDGAPTVNITRRTEMTAAGAERQIVAVDVYTTCVDAHAYKVREPR
jgi:hypothetical protein